MRAAGGIESMKMLDRMKVPVSFTILVVIQPRRNVRSAWTAGLESPGRVLMRLQILMVVDYEGAGEHDFEGDFFMIEV